MLFYHWKTHKNVIVQIYWSIFVMPQPLVVQSLRSSCGSWIWFPFNDLSCPGINQLKWLYIFYHNTHTHIMLEFCYSFWFKSYSPYLKSCKFLYTIFPIVGNPRLISIRSSLSSDLTHGWWRERKISESTVVYRRCTFPWLTRIIQRTLSAVVTR